METQVNRFWWRWLVIVTIVTGLFSISFFALPHQIQQVYAFVLFNTPDARSLYPENYDFITFLYGILGAVFFGWAISLFVTLMTTFRKGYKEGWLVFAISVSLWFVTDSAFSIMMGYTGNAIVNTAFAILFAIPLIATYPDFYGQKNPQTRFATQE